MRRWTEWSNDQGQDTGQRGKNCAYNATQNITSIRVFMAHAKINEDCCFVLLNGVAVLKATKMRNTIQQKEERYPTSGFA